MRNAVRQAINDPDFIKGMEKIRKPIAYQDSDEFNPWWEKDAQKLAQVVQRIGKISEK